MFAVTKIGAALPGLAGALIVAATPAFGQAPTYQFNMPKQSLDIALRQVARTTHAQIMFDRTAVVGKRAEPLVGRFTVDQALDRLIDGASLIAERSAGGAFLIRTAPQPARAYYSERAARLQHAALQAPDSSSPAALDPGMLPPERISPDIIVTGTRAALENAEQAKRVANVLVDGISADDIGALPDTAIAESLVRIPGITSNDRENGFEQVSIRGLGPDLAMVTYNGRSYPAVSLPDRRVNLGDLPTEGLGSALVQKTSDAATIEGGLAGTIALQSVRPLETGRHGLTLVARGIYDSVANKTGGAYGSHPLGFRTEAAYIGRPTDTLGVSLDYSYIRQSNVSPSLQFDQPRFGTGGRFDFDGDGQPDNIPGNAGIRIGATNESRHSVIGMVQWDPVSSLRLAVDGLYVHDNGTRNIQRFFASGLSTNLSMPTSVTVANDSVTQFDGQSALYREILHNDMVRQNQMEAGFNAAFDNGGPVKVTLDLSYARASQGGQTRQLTTENDAATAVDQRINVAFDTRDRANSSLVFQTLLPENYALSDILIGSVDGSDTIKAGRIDFDLPLNAPLFHDLAFGIRIQDRLKRNTPIDSESSWTNVATRPGLDVSYLNVGSNPYANVAQFLGGKSAAIFPLFDVDKVISLENASDVTVNSLTANDIAARSTIEETSYALYFQGNLDAGPLTGNIGARYIVTDNAISGFSGTTETNKIEQHASGAFRSLLPSLNLKLALTHMLAARFAYYKTVSPPSFAAQRIGSAIDLNSIGDNAILARGNPDLKPFTANNLDASLEWYPDKATSLAVQGFTKFVRNFVVSRSLPGTIALPDGRTILATINTSINDPAVRHFAGIEIIARRDLSFLPGFLSNLGVRADFERNWTDAFQVVNAVGGLSTTAMPNNFTQMLFNGQIYYSSKAVDLRLAYRTYSHYLRQADNAYQIRPGGTLDLSGSLELLRNVRATATVQNLTNAPTYEYFPDSRNSSSTTALRNIIWDGQSITFGMRAQF